MLLDDIGEGKILFHMFNKESKFSRCELYSLLVDSIPPTLFVNLAWARQICCTTSLFPAIFTKVEKALEQVTRRQQFSLPSEEP